MSNKLEEILTIVSLNKADVISDEAALESIQHIITPVKPKAQSAVMKYTDGGFEIKVDGKTKVAFGKLSNEPILCADTIARGEATAETTSAEKIARKGLVEKYRELKVPTAKADNEEWREYDLKAMALMKEGEKLIPEEKKAEHKAAGWGAGYRFRHERTKEGSSLEVIAYDSGVRYGLPEHAREVISMIEAEEFKMFDDYSATKNDWFRFAEIDKDGVERIVWKHRDEFDNTEAEEFDKFLGTHIAEVVNEMNKENVEVEEYDDLIVLKDLFNLHVSGVEK